MVKTVAIGLLTFLVIGFGIAVLVLREDLRVEMAKTDLLTKLALHLDPSERIQRTANPKLEFLEAEQAKGIKISGEGKALFFIVIFTTSESISSISSFSSFRMGSAQDPLQLPVYKDGHYQFR